LDSIALSLIVFLLEAPCPRTPCTQIARRVVFDWSGSARREFRCRRGYRQKLAANKEWVDKSTANESLRRSSVRTTRTTRPRKRVEPIFRLWAESTGFA